MAKPVPEDAPATAPGRARGLVLGTAGHIDHGKTALVRALTGIDTDRLPEEKTRGITIELGFAWLDLEDGRRVSIIDVPGHEKLVRTMVAGATGIDVLLLVVAADEGVMPQTREHVAICDLLGIERALVALTKSDLVDDEMVELAGAEVEDLLAGTGMREAALHPVSSTTGDGIPELKKALDRALSVGEPTPPRSGPPRLCVDRTFAAKGFGAVVTGTLSGDDLHVGDDVVFEPGARRAKVRGLQSHGESADTISPGARCAVNLQGIDLEAIERGDVLTRPGALAPTTLFDARVRWLAGAPVADGPTAVALLVGSVERQARLAPIGEPVLEPGSTGWARIHVDGPPVAVLPGDAFVLRGFARGPETGATWGGGRVVDVAPPPRRRSDPGLVAGLEILAKGTPGEGIRERIRRAGYAGLRLSHLRQATGLDSATLAREIDLLEADGQCVRTGPDGLIDAEPLARIEADIVERLERFHAENPMRPGMGKGALLGALPANLEAGAGARALERLESEGRIALEAQDVRLATHAATLDETRSTLADAIVAKLRAAALDPPAIRELAEAVGAGGKGIEGRDFDDLLGFLERRGDVIRAPGDLFFDAEAVRGLAGRVLAHFEANAELDTQTYKTLIGTSRRAAMPLMALLDERGLTRRSDSVRVLLDPKAAKLS